MCNLAEISIYCSHCMCNPVCHLLKENPLDWSGKIHIQKRHLHGKSGISKVLKSEYKMMTVCLELVAWSHIRVMK